MADFNDSFNMIIGTSNDTIDWFNNPYIQMVVYDLDSEFNPKPSENVKLVNCTYEEMSSFINEKAFEHYPNSLCIEDKDTIPMMNTWYSSKYESIYIAIESCDRAEYKERTGEECKSEEEINKFV